MTFTVRLLDASSTALLDCVAVDVFDEPVRADRLAAYLADPGHMLLVAVAGGQVIGQCAGVIHRHPDKPTELYVDEVGVTPAWQRRGVATAMMVELFRLGRRRGCEEAWVGTNADNAPAQALYRRFGSPPLPIVMFEYDPLPDALEPR
jgi:ribosomal protein S18 acetylase RimI-like enzyme